MKYLKHTAKALTLAIVATLAILSTFDSLATPCLGNQCTFPSSGIDTFKCCINSGEWCLIYGRYPQYCPYPTIKFVYTLMVQLEDATCSSGDVVHIDQPLTCDYN